MMMNSRWTPGSICMAASSLSFTALSAVSFYDGYEARSCMLFGLAFIMALITKAIERAA